MKTIASTPWAIHNANSLDAFVPEMWAMEGVAILVENLVAANLVHRDFEPLFARHGDVVNTRKPAEFSAKRKDNSDNVTVQDASATNIAVKLDQHVHTSFLIRDGEETKSFKSLVDEYLNPASISMARFVDQIVLAQHIQYIANQAGTLGGLTKTNAVEYISNTGLVLNKNKAHTDGRQLIWTPEAEALVVQNAVFHEADKRGDTEGLRNASIGRKLGFDHWMGQNASQPLSLATALTGAIDNGAGYTKGTTTLVVDGFTGAVGEKGTWLSINGKVYQAFDATQSASDTDGLVLTYGLLEDVADNDVVTLYNSANKVDLSGGYAAGYAKGILIDDGAGAVPTAIQVGQAISFGALDNYVVVEATVGATETEVVLDRPLENAIADNATVNLGPDGGGLNFSFHRNAMSLVIRPLQLPRPGTGAVAGLANFRGVTMRVVITYDGNKQGHLVTLDFLAGVKVLDTNLGAVTVS